MMCTNFPFLGGPLLNPPFALPTHSAKLQRQKNTDLFLPLDRMWGKETMDNGAKYWYNKSPSSVSIFLTLCNVSNLPYLMVILTRYTAK